MRYVIGVDGGGTKSSIKAYTPEGELLRSVVAEGMNYNFDGTEIAAWRLAEGIRALDLEGECLAIGIGDPSLDEDLVNEKTERFVKDLTAQLRSPGEIYLRSDVYMTLFGLTGNSEGVLVISGTGSIGTACDANGRLHTIGGWGRLIGDEGSAYSIGLAGIQAGLHAYDGVGPATALAEALPHHYRVSDMRNLINRFYCADTPEIAPFAMVVNDLAEHGDAVSIGILHRAAEYLAGCALTLIDRLYEANSAYGNEILGIYGSVLLNNQIVQSHFRTLIIKQYPDLKMIKPVLDPEAAAAQYALAEFRKRAEH